MLALTEFKRGVQPLRAAVLAWAVVARPVPCGAAPARSYSLTLAANGVCPDDGPIVTRIAARVPAAERIAAGGDVVGTVSVARDGTQIRAVVTVTRADGSVERAVSGSTCDEAADAVAFILALALDPDTVPSAVAPAASTGAAETVSEQTPSDAAAVGPRVAVASSAPAASPHEPQHSPAAGARFAAGGGVVLGVSGGVAPALAFTEGLFFEVARRSARSLTQSFRLMGFHAGQTAPTPAGNAELDLWAGRVQACPLGFGRALFVEGCAAFDLGRLRGRGYDAAQAKSDSATWYGPGALARAAAALGGPFDVGAEVGFVVPLARDRFYFLPDVTAHTIPPVAGYGFVFIALRP